METRREFLRRTAAVSLLGASAGCAGLGGGSAAELRITEAGFRGFAAVLAAARCSVGTGRRVVWCVHEARPLAGWPDDGRFPIVETGRVRDGKWRLETRGICMEFMLRMEVMGPVASTPHPRPGEAWEPTLRVADARRLMLRMLAESGVAVVSACDPGTPPEGLRAVKGTEFIEGQTLGTRRALAAATGSSDERALQARLARDFALPG